MRVHPDPLDLLRRAYDALGAWERSFGPVDPAPALAVDADRLGAALDEYLARMTAPPRGEAPGMYPFGHPRYAGQMLKPPHPVALAAYAAAGAFPSYGHRQRPPRGHARRTSRQGPYLRHVEDIAGPRRS